MDGASHLHSLPFPIVLPLSNAGPVRDWFAIFQFLWVWNDLLVALTFAGGTPEVAPLTVRLAQLSASKGRAGGSCSRRARSCRSSSRLAVFFALQRFFVRGLLAGGREGLTPQPGERNDG